MLWKKIPIKWREISINAWIFIFSFICMFYMGWYDAYILLSQLFLPCLLSIYLGPMCLGWQRTHRKFTLWKPLSDVFTYMLQWCFYHQNPALCFCMGRCLISELCESVFQLFFLLTRPVSSRRDLESWTPPYKSLKDAETYTPHFRKKQWDHYRRTPYHFPPTGFRTGFLFFFFFQLVPFGLHRA